MRSTAVRSLGRLVRGVALAVACTACGAGAARAGAEALRGGHDIGSPDAPVTVVVFGDYGCGPCAMLGRRLQEVVAARPEEVRVVYHHCPSRRHAAGRRAALLAAAAAEQGLFPEVHRALVESGPVTDEASLDQLVAGAGLDGRRLDESLRSGRAEATVARGLRLADRLAVFGTPTLLVGGRRLEGLVSREALEAVVEAALAEGGRGTGTGSDLTVQPPGSHTRPASLSP